jgi:hypothetical protein
MKNSDASREAGSRGRLGQKEMAMNGKNRIMIYGPKADGTYLVEFKTAAGESLAISVPGSEAAGLRHFQARMPYGLIVPDVREEPLAPPGPPFPSSLKGRTTRAVRLLDGPAISRLAPRVPTAWPGRPTS